jgi:VCBS repeat-containing protein
VAGGGALNVPVAIGVLSNDFDANGDPLAALLVTTTTNGALALNADGSFTYTPNSGFSGIDFFTYRASDGQLSSNTVTVNISVGSASNQAPLAASNVYTTSGGVLTVNAANGLLANDTDVNGHRLTALLVGAPQNGALSLSASGAFVYTPNPGFSGADTFTYLASDGHLTSNTATVTINVTATDNRTPVAAADAYSTTGGTISVDAAAGVLANDTDADGDPLTAELFVAPQNGAFSLNADGSFTYTPSAGFSGSDSFTYLANDGKATSAVATVTINVSGSGNTAPVAIDDTYATSSEMLHVDAASGVLANDTDAQGNGLTAELLTAPQHGTLSFHADGSFSYTPADGFNGSDTFTYRASDGSLDSNTATVTIDATPPNQAPVAVPDSYSTGADATLMVGEAEGVLDNDTDFEGDTLSAIVVTQPQHGTLTLNSDGSFEYEPDPGYTGSDSFTYRASDGEDDSEETTVMLEILPAEGEPAEGEPFPDLVDAVFGDEEDWL